MRTLRIRVDVDLTLVEGLSEDDSVTVRDRASEAAKRAAEGIVRDVDDVYVESHVSGHALEGSFRSHHMIWGDQ
jgi:hypothetical protein